MEHQLVGPGHMAQGAKGYRGYGFSLRGEKGRYVLPPGFRKLIAEASGERILCLTNHDRLPCLIGFGLERADEFENQLDREEEAALRLGREFDRVTRGAQLYGFTEVPFDSSGRFILPEHVSELGGLNEAVYFHGGGKFLTLWDPAALYQTGPEWKGAQITCRKLAEDAEAKKK